MCLSPVTVHFHDRISHKEIYRDVPCGKCIACKKRMQDDWMLRFVYHLKDNPLALFATLTYRNSTVPIVHSDDYDDDLKSLRYEDVKSWLKRCRIRYERACGKSFTYFVCGEYGPKTFRPHYHIAIFGVEYNDFMQFFQPDWQENFGFVRKVRLIDPISDGAPAYVGKYCAKPSEFELDYVNNRIVEKPQKRASRFFGIRYVNDNKNYHLASDVPCNSFETIGHQRFNNKEIAIYRRNKLSFNGFDYALPRYYYSKIFGSGQEDFSALRQRRRQTLICESFNNAKYNMQFDALCAKLSEREAIEEMSRRERERISSRYSQLHKRFDDFYNKSQY